MKEQDRIPFFSTLLPGKRVTVFAPHADDETLGCGGAILQHKRSGAQVRVVVLTDGAAGGDAETRRREVAAACQHLGVDALELWTFADRSLSAALGPLTDQIQAELLAHPSDLVYVASPWELHPDHEAAATAVWQAIARLPSAPRHVAFYEVGTPLQPNVLTDISDVVAEKRNAASCFQSQFHTIPYHDLAIALNAFRSLTLRDHGTTHAEAFYAFPGSAARSMTLSRRMHPAFGVVPLPAGPQPLSEWPEETIGIGSACMDASVIVRTKNRPHLLKNALASIAKQTTRPLEILVANDGDPVPSGMLKAVPGVRIRELMLQGLGRSAVWNRAAAVAEGAWLLVLDDDDVWFPNHIAKFNAMQLDACDFMYSDALRSNWQVQEGESDWLLVEGPFPFKGGPFGLSRLLTQNFIPTCGWAIRRTHFLAVGGIDETLDLLEDWDFLLRAARNPSRIGYTGATTSEIRHCINRGAVQDWLRARKQVQRKYPDLFTVDQMAELLEALSIENDLLTALKT